MHLAAWGEALAPLPHLVPGDVGNDPEAIGSRGPLGMRITGSGQHHLEAVEPGFVTEHNFLCQNIWNSCSIWVVKAQQLMRNMALKKKKKKTEVSPITGSGPSLCKSIILSELHRSAPAWDVASCGFICFFSSRWYWILLPRMRFRWLYPTNAWKCSVSQPSPLKETVCVKLFIESKTSTHYFKQIC